MVPTSQCDNWLQVGAEAIVGAVRKVEALSLSERAAIGAAARARYEKERDEFAQTMKVRRPWPVVPLLLMACFASLFASPFAVCVKGIQFHEGTV